MSICKNKFWYEEPSELLCNTHLLPLAGATTEDQLNSITRLIFLIFIIIAIFDLKQALMFLIASLIIIIIIYYVERKMSETTNEGFCIEDIKYPHSQRFCNDNVAMDMDRSTIFGIDNQEYKSINQKLADGTFTSVINDRANNTPPVIVPPICDPEWFTNNLYTRSVINKDTDMDVIQSGYEVQQPVSPINKDMIIENFAYASLGKPYDDEFVDGSGGCAPFRYRNIKEGYSGGHSSSIAARKIHEREDEPTTPLIKREQPPVKVQDKSMTVTDNYGRVIVNSDYDPFLNKHYIPSNASVGPIQQTNIFNDFNKNVITQTIQPGVYTRSNIIEPISSTIGISFNQQFEPRTMDVDTRNILFTRQDPITFVEPPQVYAQGCTQANDVYDPRLEGYGTSYRTYIDPLLGQPKFYYDDVDDVRRPKFIIRSNVDHLSEEQCADRIAVNNSYHQLNECRINDISEKHMRKVNNEMLVRRLAPLRRDR